MLDDDEPVADVTLVTVTAGSEPLAGLAMGGVSMMPDISALSLVGILVVVTTMNGFDGLTVTVSDTL